MQYYWFKEKMFVANELLPHLSFTSTDAPSDFWSCVRTQSISGTYEGRHEGFFLELRVDIDMTDINTPVLNIVSGDNYIESQFYILGNKNKKFKVYQASWIVEYPTMNWDKCSVEITGEVKGWMGTLPFSKVKIQTKWEALSSTDVLEVELFDDPNNITVISCTKINDTFRAVKMEVDICESASNAPNQILPNYNTHSHHNRPAGIGDRELSIEQIFKDAGIKLETNISNRIDDSAPSFKEWSIAELYDAMIEHFNRLSNRPQWELWGLLAGRYDKASTAGIMFDTLERRGFTVFRNHNWFKDLYEENNPVAQAYAMRDFLFTWVHETGHAFNFEHSWEKETPNALSWMNYPSNYDDSNGRNSFWDNFKFRFDDDELLHLRHGDRSKVIMGGSGFGMDEHEGYFKELYYDVVGELPIKFDIFSKPTFDYLEPVHVELRIKNLYNSNIPINENIHPEYDNVQLIIQHPNGNIKKYHPIVKQFASNSIRNLEPVNTVIAGSDRYSTEIFIYYGKDGFYFDTPGIYKVKAVFDFNGIPIPSNIIQFRIGYPTTNKEENLAQDYFGDDVGISLYMNGSQSPNLHSAMQTLLEVQDSVTSKAVSTRLSALLLDSIARPFHQIDGNARALKQVYKGDIAEAIKMSDKGLTFYQNRRHNHKQKHKYNNLGYANLVKARAVYLSEMDEKEQAKQELRTLRGDLSNRFVNESVLKALDNKIKAV